MRPERLLALLIVCGVAAVLGLTVALIGGVDPGRLAPRDGDDGPRGDVEVGRVIRIADGDTVTIEVDGRRERLRYIGVDAPEMARADMGAPAECGAAQALDANRRLVDGRELVLERDVSDRDRFGRLLRHPWLASDDGWILVSEALVSDGVIEARTFEPDTLREARLDQAEREAREQQLGIWGSC